jgi:hypothetical protein
VDTSFLPDKERDLKELERLKVETELRLKEEELQKKSPLDVTFSFYDGMSGYVWTQKKSYCYSRHNNCKVVERHWYEHNKHLFPASRWEISS